MSLTSVAGTMTVGGHGLDLYRWTGRTLLRLRLVVVYSTHTRMISGQKALASRITDIVHRSENSGAAEDSDKYL